MMGHSTFAAVGPLYIFFQSTLWTNLTMAERNFISEDGQVIFTNNEGQTLWDLYFHLINPVLLKRSELAQGTHLIGTKLQIQVSGKYFRTVSVTSSGVLNWLENLSARTPECSEMKKKSTIDNSKQARPISASCFSLRKCQST